MTGFQAACIRCGKTVSTDDNTIGGYMTFTSDTRYSGKDGYVCVSCVDGFARGAPLADDAEAEE